MNGTAIYRGIAGLLGFILLWELAIRFVTPEYEYLPAPSVIIQQFPVLLTDRGAFYEIAHTVGATLLGWAVAVLIGTAAGTLLGFSLIVRTLFSTSVEILRPLPAVALVPVALLVFGFSVKTELAVVIIPSIWPVLVSTMQGVQRVSGRLQDVSRSLRLTKAEAALKIFIPGAAPSILVGCRLSMTTALVLALVAEMIGNPEGVGYAVVREAQALQPAAMFAYVLITGALGILLNAAVLKTAKILLPGEFMRPSGFETGR